jgi:protease-4
MVGIMFRWLFGLLFAASLAFNIIILVGIGSLIGGATLVVPSTGEGPALNELFHSGRRDAADKIAIVRIDGVIMEGLMGYARKQIEQAAADNHVKAVIVRINSPGGSITASDDIHHRLTELRDGTLVPGNPKPLVVSMASLATSGGYYIAMPARHVMAERTTVTGSIGVYAAFPNVANFAKEHGIRMEVIKRGDVKASGSMFQNMTAQERQLWQDMIDHAYDRFLAVVKDGRGEKLKYPLDAVINEERKQIADRDAEGEIRKENGKEILVEYVRRLADGGIFTADQSQKYGLIDQIGYLDDAIVEASKLAGLGQSYRVVAYEKPRTLLGVLLGVQATPPTVRFDLNQLAEGTKPRLWYLAPQSGLSGFLAAAGQSEGQ